MVALDGGAVSGIGYTYAHKLTAKLAQELIEKFVVGKDGFDIPEIFADIRKHQRNYGVKVLRPLHCRRLMLHYGI